MGSPQGLSFGIVLGSRSHRGRRDREYWDRHGAAMGVVKAEMGTAPQPQWVSTQTLAVGNQGLAPVIPTQGPVWLELPDFQEMKETQMFL